MVAKVQSRTTAERFWSKVDKTETCWLWTAALELCSRPIASKIFCARIETARTR